MYLDDLTRLRCALLASPTLEALYNPDTTPPEVAVLVDWSDYITFYAINMQLLQTGLPCIMLSHDTGWQRDAQAMGGSKGYVTTSQCVIHFEQLIDKTRGLSDDELMTELVTLAGAVMTDVENNPEYYMVISHAPESQATPSISPITQTAESVSFRVSVLGR